MSVRSQRTPLAAYFNILIMYRSGCFVGLTGEQKFEENESNAKKLADNGLLTQMRNQHDCTLATG